MTSVGSLAIILVLIVGAAVAIKGPGLLAAAAAFLFAVLVHTLAGKTRKALSAAGDAPVAQDRWGHRDKNGQKLLARSLKLAMAQTSIASLYPEISRQAQMFSEQHAFA